MWWLERVVPMSAQRAEGYKDKVTAD
jgi:hypothetical protein